MGATVTVPLPNAGENSDSTAQNKEVAESKNNDAKYEVKVSFLNSLLHFMFHPHWSTILGPRDK